MGSNEQGDVYRSSRLVVKVAVNHPGKPMATQIDIAKFFNGSAPAANISIQTPEGKTLVANDRMVHVRAQLQRQ